MRNEKYSVEISQASMTFDFVSEGPKGLIPKRVEYRQFGDKNIYNLGFGDLNVETGEIDDKVVTDNNDSKKVLSTVASTVYTFTEEYSDAIVYARGSNAVRTRLYRMGISNNLEELTQEFDVYGFSSNIGWTVFEKNKDYSAFYIIRKSL